MLSNRLVLSALATIRCVDSLISRSSYSFNPLLWYRFSIEEDQPLPWFLSLSITVVFSWWKMSFVVIIFVVYSWPRLLRISLSSRCCEPFTGVHFLREYLLWYSLPFSLKQSAFVVGQAYRLVLKPKGKTCSGGRLIGSLLLIRLATDIIRDGINEMIFPFPVAAPSKSTIMAAHWGLSSPESSSNTPLNYKPT